MKLNLGLNNQRGSALLVIAGIMVTLSVIVDAVLVNFDSNLRSMESFSAKKQAFYMSEGVRAMVTVLLEGFLMNNSDPTALEIETYLNLALDPGAAVPLVAAPYSVSPVSVNIIKVTPSAIISSGPFKGMNGPITDLQVKFNVIAPSTVFGGNVVEPLEMRLSVGYISMFQFMAFYDVTQAEINTGPAMDMNGRLHANGDLCIGGSGGYETFLKVTVGGRLINNSDARCGNGGFNRARIATSAVWGGPYADLTAAADNGCTNCGGTGLDWDAYAVARWREQALDTAHGVQLLKLPGAGEGDTQIREASLNGLTGAVATNTDNLRFVVDPPLAADSVTVRSYKFAYNADLRIINGVWFVRDPGAPNLFPGIPIWSDHPGRYLENLIPVGQDDIRDRWALSRPWPAAPDLPRAFSYYEYDAVSKKIYDDLLGVGVISYGNLINSGAGATPQKPGHWITNGVSPLCIGGASLNCGAGGCGLKSVWQAVPYGCSAGSDPIYATNVLNATRGGFRNGHIQQNLSLPAPERVPLAHILPINFDVEQLQNALANNAPGELGSYFGAAGFTGQPFNGIVWISSFWPGSQNGYGGGSPFEHPFQGAVPDGTQALVSHPATQQALPQPLCTTGAGGPAATAFAGDAFDAQGADVRFRIPDCASYAGGGAWPNAIRVVNGATLNRLRLTKGLSIVSNIPVYLVGNFNTNSNHALVNSIPWTPALIAGDKVALISGNWNDSRSRWDVSPNLNNRPASDTTYKTAIMHEPSDTLTVLLEDWANRDLTVWGSMVYGYNAVYALHNNTCCGDQTYDPPDRIFNFDPHFGLITNQPPGTPVFPISAIAVWTKAQ